MRLRLGRLPGTDRCRLVAAAAAAAATRMHNAQSRLPVHTAAPNQGRDI